MYSQASSRSISALVAAQTEQMAATGNDEFRARDNGACQHMIIVWIGRDYRRNVGRLD